MYFQIMLCSYAGAGRTVTVPNLHLPILHTIVYYSTHIIVCVNHIHIDCYLTHSISNYFHL